MKTCKLIAVGAVALGCALNAVMAAPGGQGNGAGEAVGKSLASVPPPELAPKAAQLVGHAKNKYQEEVALAAIQYVGQDRPGSILPVVGSLAGVRPQSAAAIAAAAVKFVPSESLNIAQAAIQAAPRFSDEINRAVAGALVLAGGGKSVGPPDKDFDRGNRPEIPPGLIKTHPGTIRGNRPTIPPGHVRDPKPGRDPQRYARP